MKGDRRSNLQRDGTGQGPAIKRKTVAVFSAPLRGGLVQRIMRRPPLKCDHFENLVREFSNAGTGRHFAKTNQRAFDVRVKNVLWCEPTNHVDRNHLPEVIDGELNAHDPRPVHFGNFSLSRPMKTLALERCQVGIWMVGFRRMRHRNWLKIEQVALTRQRGALGHLSLQKGLVNRVDALIHLAAPRFEW